MLCPRIAGCQYQRLSPGGSRRPSFIPQRRFVRSAFLRLSFLLVVACVALSGLAPKAFAQQPDVPQAPADTVSFSAQDLLLQDALERFTSATGHNLVFSPRDVAGYRTSCAIRGATARQTLRCILGDLPLDIDERPSGTLVLRTRPEPSDSVHVVTGTVVDASTRTPLSGAHVYVRGSDAGTTTNALGGFELASPRDSIELVASHVGYRSAKKIHRPATGRAVVFALARATLSLTGVEVGADRVQPFEDRPISIEPGVASLPIEDIERRPSLLGQTDVLKSLQLLPGVQSGTEGTVGLHVRGGTPDQNLVLLDGAPVYNASHLLGFLSIFPPSVVDRITLTKGGIPARHGGRLSSVVSVRTKDGDANRYGADVALGLVSTRVTVEGPIWEDRTSVLVSARRTFADLLARPFLDEDDGTPRAYFYDVTGKITHRLGTENQLFASFYTGRDRVGLEETDTGSDLTTGTTFTDTERTRYAWGNQVGVLGWKGLLSSSLSGSATAFYSAYDLKIGNTVTTSETGSGGSMTDRSDIRFRSVVRDLGGNAHLAYTQDLRRRWTAGAALVHHTYRPGILQLEETTTGDQGRQQVLAPSGETGTWEGGVYASSIFDWTDRLQTRLGVRWSGVAVEGTAYFSLEPRLSARYQVGPWVLDASYTRMQQPTHRLTSSTTGLPTDLWVPTTQQVRPQVGHQVSAGVSRTLAQDLQVSLHGYGKRMRNLVAYREGTAFSLSVDTDWEEVVVAGRGWSYGAEVLVHRSTGRTTGWLGYTLSWTRHQFDDINDGEPFPARNDRRHDLSATVTRAMTEWLDLSATWVYSTGEAITLPEAVFSTPGRLPESLGSVFRDDSFEDETRVYGARNAYRVRAHHRLDVSATFSWSSSWADQELQIGAYNAYNRQNPFFLYRTEYNNQPRTPALRQVSLFPVLPAISYRLSL